MLNIGQLYQRSQTGSWYCKVDGKQVRMGPCEKTAKKERNKLIAKNGKAPHTNGQKKPNVRDMLTVYLAWYENGQRWPTVSCCQ